MLQIPEVGRQGWLVVAEGVTRYVGPDGVPRGALGALPTNPARPHCCQTCGATFKEKAKLRRHNLIHTGEKPCACPVVGCTASFTRNQNLKLHMEKCHGTVFETVI